MTTPEVAAFFHEPTCSVAYVVREPRGNRCAIIDPVLDFDARSARTSTAFADGIAAFVRNSGLEVDWVLDTHAHADHFSAASYLKEVLGGRLGIGATITSVQRLWARIYNLGPDFPVDGSQFDALFHDGDRLPIGQLEGRVIDTPGHTPGSVTYLIGDAAFVNDTILMPDYGTARADFPGGDARELYRSIRRILTLPPDTRLFVGHDYGVDGRPPTWQTTVAEQRAGNVHVHDGVDEDAFVRLRTERDKTLPMPALITQSLLVNINAGRLPDPEDNGTRYLKIPLNVL